MDCGAQDQASGIYRFSPQPLPEQAGTAVVLTVPAASSYSGVVSFDLNPAGDTAYMADTKVPRRGFHPELTGGSSHRKLRFFSLFYLFPV